MNNKTIARRCSDARARTTTQCILILTLFLPVLSAQAQPRELEDRTIELRSENQSTWERLASQSIRQKSIADYALELEEYARALSETMPLDGAGPPAVASVMELGVPLTPEKKAELADAGVFVEDHLGGTVYLVSSRPSQDLSMFSTALMSLSATGGALDPKDKVMPGALAEPDDPPVLDDEVEPYEPSFAVEFLSIVDDDEARQMLSELGAQIIEKQDQFTYVISRDSVSADDLAQILSIRVVDTGPVPFYPLNHTGRRVAETDQAQLFSLGGSAPSYNGVTGDGVRIAIADSGVDEDHDDFDMVQANGSAGSSRVYNARSGSGGHGTHVASIAAGSGVNSDANNHPAFDLRGQAPEAMVGDYSGMGPTVADYHEAIVEDGTHVSNHSYVQSMNGYGATARSIDRIVRGQASHGTVTVPPRPQVWAAGNNGEVSQYGNEEGYYAVFTSAKNTISVGSIDTRDLRLSDFSSLGPTFDGRIKPDVVAPGCIDSIDGDRILASLNNTQGYTGKCGTSMAAPVVSGIIALMMDAYENSYGVGPNLNPSTYKAILVQTARDLVKTAPYSEREFDNPDTGNPVLYYAGPDFATGYGLVDAASSVSTMQHSGKWREALIANLTDVDEFCIDVPDGAAELKATLVWDDEPGTEAPSNTAKKLVNDLDLVLVRPDSTTVLPWTLDPLPVAANPGGGGQDPISDSDVVPARRDVDRLNNVEMANVHLPESGRWIVRVTAFELPNANSQSYSLATSHAVAPFCAAPPSVHTFCEDFPDFCQIRVPTEIDPNGPDWKQPIPVREICRYVDDCPSCNHVSPNQFCPAMELELSNLPNQARIIVFDGNGDIVSRTGMDTQHTIALRNWRPGEERYLAIANPFDEPYVQDFNARIEVTSP